MPKVRSPVGSNEYPKVEGLFFNLSALTLALNILLDQSDVAQALIAADKPEVLEGYVTEILRIDPPVEGIYREARANEVVGSTTLKTGDLVYLDVTSANKDVRPLRFPIFGTILIKL